MKWMMLTSCGTSVLTNRAETALRSLAITHANAKADMDVPDPDREILSRWLLQVRAEFPAVSLDEAGERSAELNTIRLFYQGRIGKAGNDHHVLLCTDTWLGRCSAEIIRDWLLGRGISSEILPGKDLQTAHLQSFQLALSELAVYCAETIPTYRERKYSIAFNLSGGFKSTLGFLHTLGMFYADEIIYAFQAGDELLKIPRIPIAITNESDIRENLETIRRLAHDLAVDDTGGIADGLLIRMGDSCALSPWGYLVWEQAKSRIYGEKVHPPPSRKVMFSDSFVSDIQGLQEKRVRIINVQIDRLVCHLEKKERPNPSSLDFKQVKGRPVKDATHELDAWSDLDAGRMFGHFKGDVFVLVRLRKHL